MPPLLEVDNLTIAYGPLAALRGASLVANAGEVIGIVGESGCGKSTLIAGILGLNAANARVLSGAVRLEGTDLLGLPPDERRRLRGRDIAMVFQDPMTAFNPVIPLGDQLVDFQHHDDTVSLAEKRARAERMLARVGIPDAGLRLDGFAHEISGGMRQRVAIAAALLAHPKVLIADEPTTALDLTMEAQIIHLLRELRDGVNGAILIVSHHLGVIAELVDRVYVMYAGEIVEEGPVEAIFDDPRHPYTKALLACDPARFHEDLVEFPVIPGELPSLAALPAGCVFQPRCARAEGICATPPTLLTTGDRHAARCHFAGTP